MASATTSYTEPPTQPLGTGTVTTMGTTTVTCSRTCSTLTPATVFSHRVQPACREPHSDDEGIASCTITTDGPHDADTDTRDDGPFDEDVDTWSDVHSDTTDDNGPFDEDGDTWSDPDFDPALRYYHADDVTYRRSNGLDFYEADGGGFWFPNDTYGP